MGRSFHVDTDQLRNHATVVDDLTTRAGTAADAGRQGAGISTEMGAVSAAYAAAAEATSWVWGGPASERGGQVLLKLQEAIHGLEWLLAALRNMLDGVYGGLSALAESKHAEVAS